MKRNHIELRKKRNIIVLEKKTKKKMEKEIISALILLVSFTRNFDYIKQLTNYIIKHTYTCRAAYLHIF